MTDNTDILKTILHISNEAFEEAESTDSVFQKAIAYASALDEIDAVLVDAGITLDSETKTEKEPEPETSDIFDNLLGGFSEFLNNPEFFRSARPAPKSEDGLSDFLGLLRNLGKTEESRP